MKVEYYGRPAYTLAVCYLDLGETVRVERGAMATMSDGLAVGADTGPGGIVKGLVRKQLGGESLFMGRYTAQRHNAWVAVSPKSPGDIIDIELGGGPAVIAESGALLAMTEGIEVDVRWAGTRAIMLREGATMLKAHGHGHLLLCTYGGFVRHWLEPGQTVIVDTGHLVAYEETIGMKVGPLSGLMTAGFTGEGLVAEMTAGSEGGAVYIQTRAEVELRSWLFPERQQNRR